MALFVLFLGTVHVDFTFHLFLQRGDILVGGSSQEQQQQPWVQQSGGCGRPGEALYLPATAILTAAAASSNSNSNSSTATTKMGQALADLWIRLRYGVFGEMETAGRDGSEDSSGAAAMFVTSRQAAECEGATVRQVVFRHPDFAHQSSSLFAGNWSSSSSFLPSPPVHITVMRPAAPRLVVVLENSAAMNLREEWDYVRAACKKFLLHDLPPEAEVGLVLFNEEAHVAANVVRLGRRMAAAGPRNELAFAVKSKHHLSPLRTATASSSCVRCGVAKAIEALQVARSGGGGGHNPGGALIIISRGGGGSSNNNGDEERELRRLSTKHGVQLFPITIGGGNPTQQAPADAAAGLERAAHFSRGASWLLAESSYAEQRASLATYLGLVDALREIQGRVLPKSAPHLVS